MNVDAEVRERLTVTFPVITVPARFKSSLRVPKRLKFSTGYCVVPASWNGIPLSASRLRKTFFGSSINPPRRGWKAPVRVRLSNGPPPRRRYWASNPG